MRDDIIWAAGLYLSIYLLVLYVCVLYCVWGNDITVRYIFFVHPWYWCCRFIKDIVPPAGKHGDDEKEEMLTTTTMLEKWVARGGERERGEGEGRGRSISSVKPGEETTTTTTCCRRAAYTRITRITRTTRMSLNNQHTGVLYILSFSPFKMVLALRRSLGFKSMETKMKSLNEQGEEGKYHLYWL